MKAVAIVTGILLVLWLSGPTACSAAAAHADAPGAPSAAYKVYGLDFSPYMDGQDPNQGSTIAEAQLRSRLAILAPYTGWVRSFGMTHGLERTGAIAHEMGFKVALGAWLGRDLAANEVEIANLIAAGQAGQADLLIVGSEVLLRGDLSEEQLAGYMARVKQAVPGIPISTADVHGEILAHPGIVATEDVVLVNYYPYWEGVREEAAVAVLHGWHQQVMALAGSKPVIVSETGWPSCGNTVGDAVPSPQNASAYFLNFVSWARANSVSYFYFEGFDESWKAGYEGPQGACWGIWDRAGQMKPGMQAVFDGQTVADNWSGTAIPGGPGTPAIELTYVPPMSSSNHLRGRVWHVRPVDYRVAVYIRVRGRVVDKALVGQSAHGDTAGWELGLSCADWRGGRRGDQNGGIPRARHV